MVTNTIKPAAPAAENKKSLIEYESNGEKVSLSADTVRKYLVNGDGKVTDQEVMMFLTLCRYQHLNPFLKEAYLIKYGNNAATIVTGKDVFTKRAQHNPNFKGMQAGVLVVSDGELIEREGALVIQGEELVGGWARVYVNGYSQPIYSSASFEEYAGRKKDGELNSQWKTKPATMIRKVAIVQALREAFPDNYEGMNAPEEITEANIVFTDTAADIPAPELPKEDPVETPAPEIDDPESALFN